MAEQRNIELRSEKVRNIVGKIPPAVDRYGIAVIGLVLIVVVTVSMLIPYKETVRFGVRFDSSKSKNEGEAYVESHHARLLQKEMPVTITVNNEKVEGKIVSISSKRTNGMYKVGIKTSYDDEITVAHTLNAEVIVMDRNWFEAIRGRR